MEQLQNWLMNVDKSIFERVQITLEPISYDGIKGVSKIYFMYLHKICLFFGNIYEACLIAHFMLYLLATVIWYLVIKSICKKIIPSIILTMCVFIPLGFMLSVTLNPFVLWLVLFGLVVLIIVHCAKVVFQDEKESTLVSELKIENAEPTVTVVDFEKEKAITIPEKEDRPVIFIPKSMEIPKRVSKPKLDYSEAVAIDNLFYDMDVADLDDFDLPNIT